MSQLEEKNLKKLEAVDNEIEIDVFELLGFFLQKIRYIIFCFLVGAVGAGCIAAFLITPKYQATSKLYMVSASSESIVNLSDLNLGTSLSSDYEELLKTRPIIESVIEELGLEQYDYKSLLDIINIATIGDTRILGITVTSTDPEEACEIANCLAELGMDYLPRVMETAKPNEAEAAVVPKVKSSPSITRWTAIGALVCMLLCLGVLTVFYVMDDTLKTSDDVEKYLGIMPLSVVPEGDFGDTSSKKKKKRIWKKKRKSKKKQNAREK